VQYTMPDSFVTNLVWRRDSWYLRWSVRRRLASYPLALFANMIPHKPRCRIDLDQGATLLAAWAGFFGCSFACNGRGASFIADFGSPPALILIKETVERRAWLSFPHREHGDVCLYRFRRGLFATGAERP
jgi:hypothetical protein